MKLIRNVSLPAGNSFKKVNVLFDNTIEQIGSAINESGIITEEYDYSGCILIPGAVDIHTHILNGSKSDSQNLAKCSKYAVSGGFTTLADMSYTTSKPIFKKTDLSSYEKVIKDNSFADIALWGHCNLNEFPYHIDLINEMWSEGVVGFIVFQPSPNQLINSVSSNEMMDLFDEIYDSDISFAFQGYDTEEVLNNTIDALAELRQTAIRKLLRRLQDNPIHFVGIYDKPTIDILNVAYRKADLTYAFPIYKLIKTIHNFDDKKNSKNAINTEFIKLIMDSIKNGKIYTISSEAGSRLNTKSSLFNHTFSGYSEDILKWIVPWIFTELWKKKRASIQSCIRLLSENPAKRLGLFPQKGSILKGADADFIIIDPEKTIEVNLFDKIGETQELSCTIRATFLRGNLVYPFNNKRKPQGHLIRRKFTTRRKNSQTCWS